MHGNILNSVENYYCVMNLIGVLDLVKKMSEYTIIYINL